MLKVKVKVGPINNLSDARYCAGMGVDMLGFSIGGFEDTIDPKKYQEITGWVSGPEFVLEWSGAGIPPDFTAILQSYNASIVQIDVQLLKNIPQLDTKLIVALPLNAWHSCQQEIRLKKPNIAYLLLSGSHPQSDRDAIAEIAKEFPVLLSEIGANELERLSTLPVAGISMRGTAESRPGITDYSNLEEVLERLEVTEE